ncbi:hypothetical protein AVEN_190896-1 [Araneus ventricosus]|uniref:Uncharacterized protein n=1 Tax=Araneus ventricosus TaxID=182803 RepID=A0A4Y2CQF3_ARAVE|nr:hypothetical protein AVEN_190896-1 [Araneus ventricosus]
MQDKLISSWKRSDSISWTLYMTADQERCYSTHLRFEGKVLSKSVRQAISNTLALREVHVQCITVITALQAAYRFSNLLPLVICPTQLQQALVNWYRTERRLFPPYP